jgi:hypothetical protein
MVSGNYKKRECKGLSSFDFVHDLIKELGGKEILLVRGRKSYITGNKNYKVTNIWG